MKFKKTIKSTVLGVLSIAVLSATAQQDPKAKDILDKVANKTKSYSSIKAQFTNTLSNEVEDFSESFEGTIYIKDKRKR